MQSWDVKKWITMKPSSPIFREDTVTYCTLQLKNLPRSSHPITRQRYGYAMILISSKLPLSFHGARSSSKYVLDGGRMVDLVEVAVQYWRLCGGVVRYSPAQPRRPDGCRDYH